MEATTETTETEKPIPTPTQRKRKRKKVDPELEISVEEAEAEAEADIAETPTPRRRTRVQREMVESSDSELRGWIESLGVHDDFRLKIERRQPKKVRLKDGSIIDISGHLETFEDFVDEDDIKEMFGGGTYTAILMRKNDVGRFEFFKSRTVKVPGKPNMSQYEDSPSSNGTSDSLSAQAMATMKELIGKGNSNGGGQEMLSMMQTMMAPVMAQLEASQAATRDLQTRVAEKDAQLMQTLVDSGKADPGQSALIDKMWGQESGRLESLRMQFDSEKRQLVENQREDMKRLDQNNKENIRRLEDAHKREIDNLNRSFEGQISAYKTSYETRIDGLKSEIERLNREMTAKQAEVGELRAKKDKSIADQAMELAGIQESLGNVFGNKGEETESKWYEKLAGVVMENPDTIKQLVGAPQNNPQSVGNPAAPPARDPQLPPAGQPFQTGDGNVYVSDEAGTVRALSEEEVEQLKAEHAAAEAAAAKEARKPNPQETKVAVMFIENAIRNGTPPETFAESAKSAIPADILRYLETEGVDSFLSEVADLESSSPLRSQKGRNWIRKVAKYLLEGVTE